MLNIFNVILLTIMLEFKQEHMKSWKPRRQSMKPIVHQKKIVSLSFFCPKFSR